MDLESLRIFVTVAELASFTRAAEQLGLAKAPVSTAVQRLESGLGARLLQRTTRNVRLTPDGEQFLERARALVAEADRLQAMFRQAGGALRGRLRVDLPTILARDVIIPRLPEFLAAHPLLELAVGTTDRLVDPVLEGYDCVLRVGGLADSGLVARRIGLLPVINAASPAYLARHGTPRTLADLDQHRVVHYSSSLVERGAGFEYLDGETTRLHPMRSAVTVDGTDAYQSACLAGLGLIQAPAPGLRRLIAEGRLVEVLPEHRPGPMPVSLLYPHRRHLAPRVQAFMGWLAQVLAPSLALAAADADAAA
jgi:DNA-binding transcriptional LysR family regulator